MAKKPRIDHAQGKCNRGDKCYYKHEDRKPEDLIAEAASASTFPRTHTAALVSVLESWPHMLDARVVRSA